MTPDREPRPDADPPRGEPVAGESRPEALPAEVEQAIDRFGARYAAELRALKEEFGRRVEAIEPPPREPVARPSAPERRQDLLVDGPGEPVPHAAAAAPAETPSGALDPAREAPTAPTVVEQTPQRTRPAQPPVVAAAPARQGAAGRARWRLILFVILAWLALALAAAVATFALLEWHDAGSRAPIVAPRPAGVAPPPNLTSAVVVVAAPAAATVAAASGDDRGGSPALAVASSWPREPRSPIPAAPPRRPRVTHASPTWRGRVMPAG